MKATDKCHRLARQHLVRQPSIEDDILEALRANVFTSYRSLSRYINGRYNKTIKQYEDYHLYNKTIKPGLKAENKVKQVD
jgi:hypothetical protein